jgi:hypothetical protein
MSMLIMLLYSLSKIGYYKINSREIIRIYPKNFSAKTYFLFIFMEIYFHHRGLARFTHQQSRYAQPQGGWGTPDIRTDILTNNFARGDTGFRTPDAGHRTLKRDIRTY